MQQQPNVSVNQTPQGQHQQPNSNVPDHRFNELQAQMRRLEDQNKQLRSHIDFMAQNNNPQNTQTAPQQTESPFQPEVDKALDAKIQAALNAQIDPLKSTITQQVGYLVDRADELGYMQKYGGNETYSKYNDKVEQLRNDYQMRGQYLNREEALRLVYFEETGKKSKEAPMAPVNTAPIFDTYLGQYVDPVTRQPVSMEQVHNPAQTQPGQVDPNQVQQPGQAPQPQEYTPGWQQPTPQQQPAPQPTGQMPTGFEQPRQASPMNPYGPQAQAPQLPPQGVNSPYPGQGPQNASSGHMNLSIDASDAELEAFEQKYGDMAL